MATVACATVQTNVSGSHQLTPARKKTARREGGLVDDRATQLSKED